MLPGQGAWSLAGAAPLAVPGPGQCQSQASSWPTLGCLSHPPLGPLHRAQLFKLSRTRAGTTNMAAMGWLPRSGGGNRISRTRACSSLCPGIFCLVHQFLAGPAAALVLNKAGIQSVVQQLEVFEDRSSFSFQGMTRVTSKGLETLSSEFSRQRVSSAVHRS